MKNKLKNGFSLIELSITLVILGILISSGLVVAAQQLESSKLTKTHERLQVVTDAIQLYYEINGALPCPADGEDALSDANFGIALAPIPIIDSTPSNVACNNATYTITANSYVGMLPVRSLNLPDYYSIDGWWNRYTYAVSKDCVDPDNWTGTPKNCTSGNIVINDNLDPTPRNRTNTAAYAVISHGRNGLGAWQNSGTPNSDPTANREIENANFDSDIIFTDDIIFDPNTATANYFDDIIIWRTAPQIEYEANN